MINLELLSNRAIRGTHYKAGARVSLSPGSDLDYMIRRGMVKKAEAVEAAPVVKRRRKKAQADGF